jgi:small subunit ribosomal protein S1
MEENENDFMQDMEQLLDEHDYALPEVGDIRTGIVVSITPQGVIVDLGLKRDGIIQPVDLEKLTKEERDAIQVNDEIAVYILSTDAPDSLIVSRHMALLNQDWIRAEQLLESGEIFEGEIVGYNRGGVLVAFGGLRGFIPASHLTMLSPNLNEKQRQQRLSKLRDEIVPLKVIEVDRRRRRLVLSQRDAEKEWREARRQELMERISPGDVFTGRVSGWRDFGAFVDLGGVDGLVHVSELAWYRVNHPREVVQIGDEVQVYVLRVDREKQRISLSRKKLLPNPWSLVEERYAVGQLVEGRIIRIVDYGAFIELEPGVEGLLHVSQISRTSVTDPREVVTEGETHLLRVISVDTDRERIGLSLKAVRAQEQIEWMTQRELEAAEKDAATKAEDATPPAAVPEEPQMPAAPEAVAEAEADMADAPEATELAPTEEAGEMEMVETEVEEQSGMVIDAAEEAVEETIEDESAEEIAAEAPEETVDFEVTTEEYAAEAPEETVDFEVTTEEYAAEAPEETVDFEVGTEEKPAEPAVLENEDDSSEDDSDSE